MFVLRRLSGFADVLRPSTVEKGTGRADGEGDSSASKDGDVEGERSIAGFGLCLPSSPDGRHWNGWLRDGLLDGKGRNELALASSVHCVRSHLHFFCPRSRSCNS